MAIEDLLIADGDALDCMAAISPAIRSVFGADKSIKPNDNCYWDSDLGLWMEDDKTFRSRIKSSAWVPDADGRIYGTHGYFTVLERAK